MANVNWKNVAVVEGRLAKDPYFAPENSDGSRTVFLTIMVDSGRTDKDGKKLAPEAINCQRYLPKGTDLSAWPYGVIKQGDRVRVTGHLENGAYRQADGTMNYDKNLVFVIGSVDGAEPRSAREARAQRRAAAEAEAAETEVATAVVEEAIA